MKNRAFTLAEVLITLMVIGIVAALTIPSLLNSYRERETVTRVLKGYSTLANAYKQAMTEYDSIAELSAHDEQFHNLLKFLNTAKVCSVTNQEEGCFATNQMTNLTGWEDWAGWAFGQKPSAILNDGTSIIFWGHDPLNCNAGAEGILCSVVFFDTNGPEKGPNQLGRDIFYFEITKNGVSDRVSLSDGDNLCSLSDEYYSRPRNGAGCTNYVTQNKNMNYLHE